MYTIGEFIGSLLLAYVLTRIFYFMKRKFFPEMAKVNSIIFACIFFLAFSTVLGGYGFSIDDHPVFAHAFFQYLPAAVIFLIFDLYKLKSNVVEAEILSVDTNENKNANSPSKSEKKFCADCGEKIQSSSKFCGGCGAAV